MRSGWESAFIEALRRTRDITRSARIAGVARSVVYYHYERHEAFAAKWNAAVEHYDTEQLRAAMKRLHAELGPE